MPQTTLTEALEAHLSEIMGLPGVVGAGESECAGVPCIRVYVVEETPELAERIPEALEGYRVVVEVSGELRALD